MKSSHFSTVLPLASSSSLNRMLAQARAYFVHQKKALALENLVWWIAVELMGQAGTHTLWLEGGWIWWHSLVSLKSDGSSWRAGKGCSKSCDGFSWTTLLELSSSVPRVLIRATVTILPKDLSSLNSWFNKIIVIHKQTTMWHVNVFFLTYKKLLCIGNCDVKESQVYNFKYVVSFNISKYFSEGLKKTIG